MFSPWTWLRSGFLVVASGLGGILVGASNLFGRRERQMLQVFFFVITGTAIIAAGWWWATSVYENYLRGERAPSLGAVEIHGIEGDQAALKREFPSLILSEMNALQAKANSAIAAMRQAKNSISSASRLPADTRFQDVEAPSLLTAPFDVELKIADVDVGSLLSWLSKRTTESDQLKLNIVFNKDRTKATVYGTAIGRPGYSFSVQADGTVEDIVQEVATAIIQKEAVKSDERLVSLNASSFTKLIESLNAFALAEKEALFLKADRIATNKNLLEQLKGVGSFSQFPELQWLMGKTAENAELWTEAIQYYGNLLAYYDSGRAINLTEEDLGVRRREIGDKLAALQARAKAAEVALAQATDATQEPPGLEKLRSSTTCGDYAPIWNQLGMSQAMPAGNVSVGMVGAPSSQVSDALKGQILPQSAQAVSPGSARSSDVLLDDYLASLGQAVRAVAADVKFVFAGLNMSTTTTDAQIISSLQALIDAEVRVVLMTFGASHDLELNPSYRALVESAKDKTIFVFTAGNEGTKGSFPVSPYAGLADIALISQALDTDGRTAAYFTSVADGGVWTRGVEFPVCSLASGEPTTGSGTSHSAALVAAIAALLVQEFPKAQASQIVTAMKAASGGPPESPRPLTYPTAKAQLEALLKPPS